MKTILYILFFLFLMACASVNETTEIKNRVIKPETIADSVKVSVKTDTVVVGYEIVKHDTTILVRYFPKKEKFYIKVRPDSIVLYDTVKTKQIIEKKIETPFLSKAGIFFLGAALCLAAMFFIKIKR